MKVVLCYGDSNTFGLMPDLANRYPRNIRWTGRLQQLLGDEYYVIEEGLGGRTTVWDDPIEEHKNGKTYLLPCLESHRPIDLVILMLGTNDLKERFHVSSFGIASAIENLLNAIDASKSGPGFEAPKVLLVSPVPIRDVGNRDLHRMLENGFAKSHDLPVYCAEIAQRRGIAFLDPSELVQTSDIDGIHYTERGHEVMAKLMEAKVREILGEENA